MVNAFWIINAFCSRLYLLSSTKLNSFWNIPPAKLLVEPSAMGLCLYESRADARFFKVYPLLKLYHKLKLVCIRAHLDDSQVHNHFWILDDVTNMDVVVGPRGNSFITLFEPLRLCSQPISHETLQNYRRQVITHNKLRTDGGRDDETEKFRWKVGWRCLLRRAKGRGRTSLKLSFSGMQHCFDS